MALLELLALSPSWSAAAQEGEPVVIGEGVTLGSEILGENRRVLIHLPVGYDRSRERFPVLYLLDGGGHFHHVTGITRFLTSA